MRRRSRRPLQSKRSSELRVSSVFDDDAHFALAPRTFKRSFVVIRFIRLDMSEPCLRSALRAAWKRQMTLSRSKLRCTHGTALWALTTNAARASIKNDAASWSQTFCPPKDWPKFAKHSPNRKIQKDPTAYSQVDDCPHWSSHKQICVMSTSSADQ
jgi:hypothetical protein